MEGKKLQDFTVIHQSEEDAGLARGLAGRDPHALATLYDRYGRLTYLVVHRIVGSESAAEDLVQETFLKVWNSIHLYDQKRGSLGRWILSVARYRAIDYLRSWEGRMAQGALPIQEWDEPSAAAGFEHDVLNMDVIRALRGAMARLTPRQRKLLDLAYVEGLTQVEMAKRLEKPLGTVKTWVRAALQALRTEMAPYRESAV